MPIFIPVYITQDAVKSVAQKLLGSYDPGSMDSEYLQVRLLKFGKTSKDFMLALKLSLTGQPIRAYLGRPIMNLCLASLSRLTNFLKFVWSEQEKPGDNFFWGSQDLNPPAHFMMTRCVTDLNQELMADSTGFNISGALSRPRNIGYSWRQKNCSTISIKP